MSPPAPHSGIQYRMIDKAEIKNFRGFVDTSLSDIRRINIVVGDNGSGKTTLLEALFCAAAQNHEIVLKLRRWRGMPTGGGGIGRQSVYEGLWGDLFNEFDLSKVVSVSLYGTKHDTRTIRMFTSPAEPTRLPLSDDEQDSYTPYNPVTFEWSHPFGEPVSVTPILQKGELVGEPLPDSNVSGSFLAARAPFSTSENAVYFSELSKNSKETDFIGAMKKQFTDIESISVEIDFATPMLFVKHNWQTRKYPIHILSDGMNKMAAILLNIANRKAGVVFVDEIDTGIYFKRYELFVRQLHDFCRQYDSQIFATTHSLEFLKSALPTLRQYSEDFSLIRVYRERDVSKATIVNGEDALSLIESGLEVRA